MRLTLEEVRERYPELSSKLDDLNPSEVVFESELDYGEYDIEGYSCPGVYFGGGGGSYVRETLSVFDLAGNSIRSYRRESSYEDTLRSTPWS